MWRVFAAMSHAARLGAEGSVAAEEEDPLIAEPLPMMMMLMILMAMAMDVASDGDNDE